MSEIMKRSCLAFLWLALAASIVAQPSSSKHELTIMGTGFRLDGKPFAFTGVSFFNAIYNTNFNASSAARLGWLRKFQSYGIHHRMRVLCWNTPSHMRVCHRRFLHLHRRPC